jgi:superfamily II DNA or RNA helicase
MHNGALRPYQKTAIDAVLNAWVAEKKPLVVMPTGTGKTVVFAKVAEASRVQGRSLVLAHREELIHQAVEKIRAWTDLSTAIEMADARADDTLLPADVVVASVQTMVRRLSRYAPASFARLIIDEAHHAPADTYRKIIDHFVAAKILGVTATPDRLDKQALGQVFNDRTFIYELRDAIEDKWLVPIRQRIVMAQKLDFSQVRTTAGDLNEGDLERILIEERALHEVAEPTVRLSEDRPTLVFATTVLHAKSLAEVMRRYAGDTVQWLDGDAPRALRRQTLADFRDRKFRFLVNCLLYTEGFDEPLISCVAVARPTKSRALYAQMIGRGTRLCCPNQCPAYCEHAEAKRNLVVLDFVGNAGKHQLVNAIDVLDGVQDAAVRGRAIRLMEGQAALDILGALDQAAQQLADEERDRIMAEARRREAVRAHVQVRIQDIDPFAILGIRPRAGRWGGEAMTDVQREVLERHKIPLHGLDRGQAEEIAKAIRDRVKQGLCSVRQARLLASKGIDPTGMPFERASAIIDRIQVNAWRVPPELWAEVGR